MNGKVVPSPMQISATSEPNALWFISVGSTYDEQYTCKYRDKDGYWVIDVKAKTLAGAMALAVQCCGTIGQNQAVSSRGEEG